MKKYDKIIPYLYAQRPKKVRENYVKTLNKNDCEYIIFSDYDTSTCMTYSKNILKDKISTIKLEKTVIAKTEIESWYLAGLDRSASEQLQITYHPTTDEISKEQFNQMKPSRFDSRIDFMQEILKKFNVQTAKKQNSSFLYMWQKFVFTA